MAPDIKDTASLTPPERLLLKAVEDGKELAFDESANDDTRRLRASVLRAVLIGRDAPRCDPSGVRITGAIIQGELDLRGGTLPCGLELTRCRLEALDARNLKAPWLTLATSEIARNTNFQACRIEGNLTLDGTAFAGQVFGQNIKVEGNLYAVGSRFLFDSASTEEGRTIALVKDDAFGDVEESRLAELASLSLDGGDIKGVCNLDRASIEGNLSSVGLCVEGDLTLRNSSLRYTGVRAWRAYLMRVTGNLVLTSGFEASGGVRLFGAKVGGQWSCRGGRFLREGGSASTPTGSRSGGASSWTLTERRSSWRTAGG